MASHVGSARKTTKGKATLVNLNALLLFLFLFLLSVVGRWSLVVVRRSSFVTCRLLFLVSCLLFLVSCFFFLVLFCFVLFCFVLFCFVLFCFVLFCFVLFCFVLFCFVLFCFVLFCFVLFCFVLFCFVLFCFVLFCFVLFCFVLFCFVLFCLFFLSSSLTRDAEACAKYQTLHELLQLALADETRPPHHVRGPSGVARLSRPASNCRRSPAHASSRRSSKQRPLHLFRFRLVIEFPELVVDVGPVSHCSFQLRLEMVEPSTEGVAFVSCILKAVADQGVQLVHLSSMSC